MQTVQTESKFWREEEETNLQLGGANLRHKDERADLRWSVSGFYPLGGHTVVDTICYFNEFCCIVVNVATAPGSEVLRRRCVCVCVCVRRREQDRGFAGDGGGSQYGYGDRPLGQLWLPLLSKQRPTEAKFTANMDLILTFHHPDVLKCVL